MPHNSNHKQQEFLSAPTQERPVVVDADGDTQMSRVSGLSTSQLAAIVNAVNSKNSNKSIETKYKPPAPWKSPEEFAVLRAAGRCTGCVEKCHFFKKCPKFSWAKRPANENVAFTQNSKLLNSRSADKDGEDREFGNSLSENE